jgi:hypothetical protein
LTPVAKWPPRSRNFRRFSTNRSRVSPRRRNAGPQETRRSDRRQGFAADARRSADDSLAS